jgi:hypothetical protein
MKTHANILLLVLITRPNLVSSKVYHGNRYFRLSAASFGLQLPSIFLVFAFIALIMKYTRPVSKNEIVIIAFARNTLFPWNFLITPPLAKKMHPARA